jgi:hypothetical protein
MFVGRVEQHQIISPLNPHRLGNLILICERLLTKSGIIGGTSEKSLRTENIAYDVWEESEKTGDD